MSSTAIYTFVDNESKYSVYKHWDNDPENAVEYIKKALEYAWKLPRFEAPEFATAFIAANKKEASNISLVKDSEEWAVDYHYHIACVDGKIYIKINTPLTNTRRFEGFLEDVERYINKIKGE